MVFVGRGRVGFLRERSERGKEVLPIELFFDLVYVLAVTQLTHYLLEHLSPRGAVETLTLLLVVWGAWIHVAWTANYFDVGTRPMRLGLLVMMLLSLVMSASIPAAFAGRGLVFAGAVTAILGGWSLLLNVAIGAGHHLRPVFSRVLFWEVVTSALLLAGGLAQGDVRLALWLLGVGAIYVAMWMGFPVPGRGRNLTSDYTISGEHLAHRCLLFVILALGESILVTGAAFGALPGSGETTAAFVVAFVGSAALWWIYFDRAEAFGMEAIAAASDPGRLGLTAYTFFHIPMVAGVVVVAAGDEISIAHPGDAATFASASLILGGPVLFLVGNALFTWALWRRVPRSRLAAIAGLLGLAPVAGGLSTLRLAAAATAVLVALAVWDLRLEARGPSHAVE